MFNYDREERHDDETYVKVESAEYEANINKIILPGLLKSVYDTAMNNATNGMNAVERKRANAFDISLASHQRRYGRPG